MKKARYTDDFKREAVNQVLIGGRQQAEVAESLGISTSALCYWVKKNQSNISDEDAAQIGELDHLRKENRRLRMENDILKKATAIFSRVSS